MSASGPIRSHPHVRFHGGFRRERGLVVLTLSSSVRDPQATLRSRRSLGSLVAICLQLAASVGLRAPSVVLRHSVRPEPL